MANRAIIISLHPEWWREIRLGAKLLEIRKTRPRVLRRRSRTGENLRILRVKGRKRILPHAGSAEKEAGTAAPEAEDSGADIYREKRGLLVEYRKVGVRKRYMVL